MALGVQGLNQTVFHLNYRNVSTCCRLTVFYLGLWFKMADLFVAVTADLFRELPIKALNKTTRVYEGVWTCSLNTTILI